MRALLLRSSKEYKRRQTFIYIVDARAKIETTTKLPKARA